MHRGLPLADHPLYDDTQSLNAGMRWINSKGLNTYDNLRGRYYEAVE